MPRVTVGDNSIPIHQFQAALHVSFLFLEHLPQFDPPDDSNVTQSTLLENLDERWQLLNKLGDQPPEKYSERLQGELRNIVNDPGHGLFKNVVAGLENPFNWQNQLLAISERALQQVQECVLKWGGPKARARVSHLQPLPIHCETTGDDQAKYFFDREEMRLLVRPGSLKLMLLECMILEFSLFHEYLSHFFPPWKQDREEISDGFLFALEFEWYLSSNTLFDDELFEMLWRPRLGGRGREYYRQGQWLLRRRCERSQDCFGRFLLEWVAAWPEYPDSLHLDLMSQLSGIVKRMISRFALPPKYLKTIDILHAVLCEGCLKGRWNLNHVTNEFAQALAAYGVPK
jgi:hypothetical protein